MAYEKAGYTQESAYNPVHLLASGGYTTRKVTILSGQVLIAGAVLGALVSGLAATAGNPISGTGATPGNGSLGALTVDNGAPVGDWMVRFNDATHFDVLRPDGTIEGVGVLGTAYNGGINFNGTAGGTAFVEDDRIIVTVDNDDAVTKHKLSLKAATDGSQAPDTVLAYDCDATGGDVEAIAYETATVVAGALMLGTGHTIASIREPLRLKGILIDD
ncbi:MAG: hypothetical protein COA80_16185 [Leeuwenhoekiella sp.]|nr:MAG: hypothetical protein COA80_16185 [Leeuwenhoekiella sp.]